MPSIPTAGLDVSVHCVATKSSAVYLGVDRHRTLLREMENFEAHLTTESAVCCKSLLQQFS